MTTHANRPVANQRLLVYVVVFSLAGCSRTPSIDILGSFFPAWLVCFAAGSLLTALTRLTLMRLHMRLDLPVLAYPSLAALFTFGLWLIFYY
jgi:hypothetical protein